MDCGSDKDFFANYEIGDDDVFEDIEVRTIAKDLHTMTITKSQPNDNEDKVEPSNMELCETVKNQLYFDATYDAELYEVCAKVDKSNQPSTSSNTAKTRVGATKRKSTNKFFDMEYDGELYEVCRLVDQPMASSSSFAGPMRFGRAGAKRKVKAKVIDSKRPRYDEASTSSGIRSRSMCCVCSITCKGVSFGN